MKNEEFDEIIDKLNEIKEPLEVANEKSKEFARWLEEKDFRADDFTKEQLATLDRLEDELNDLTDTMFDID